MMRRLKTVRRRLGNGKTIAVKMLCRRWRRSTVGSGRRRLMVGRSMAAVADELDDGCEWKHLIVALTFNCGGDRRQGGWEKKEDVDATRNNQIEATVAGRGEDVVFLVFNGGGGQCRLTVATMDNDETAGWRER
jgi:hypothetical protein